MRSKNSTVFWGFAYYTYTRVCARYLTARRGLRGQLREEDHDDDDCMRRNNAFAW